MKSAIELSAENALAVLESCIHDPNISAESRLIAAKTIAVLIGQLAKRHVRLKKNKTSSRLTESKHANKLQRQLNKALSELELLRAASAKVGEIRHTVQGDYKFLGWELVTETTHTGEGEHTGEQDGTQ